MIPSPGVLAKYRDRFAIPGGTSGKEHACQCRRHKRWQFQSPGLGKALGGGHGNPLQYSFLENPIDRGAWLATVHRVTKSGTWLKQLSNSIRDIFRCYNWGSGTTGDWWRRPEVLINFPQSTGEPPLIKNYLVQNVSSFKAEKFLQTLLYFRTCIYKFLKLLRFLYKESCSL